MTKQVTKKIAVTKDVETARVTIELSAEQAAALQAFLADPTAVKRAAKVEINRLFWALTEGK